MESSRRFIRSYGAWRLGNGFLL